MKQFHVCGRALGLCAFVLLLAGCNGSGSSVGFQPAFSANGEDGSTSIAPDKRGKIKIFTDDYADPVPVGIAAGPDGNLWIADPGNDTIARMTTHGAFTFYRPGVEISIGITVGPDSAIWFTTAQDSPEAFIGRITTKGAVTLFKDPKGSYPQGITSGPDGALWFGESNGTVGRITTSGNVTHFLVGPPKATIFSIVTGPDGALWATLTGDYVHSKIIRMETSGKVRKYDAPNGPEYICVGPDQALWFTESENLIGRITTAGTLTEFPIKGSSSGGGPVGIATGPDGALWFTEDFFRSAAIGRMTTAGKMTFYAVPSSGAPSLAQITLGPFGDMWFVRPSPAAVGRITTR